MRDPLRVLIAGGGVAALEALLALRELAETGMEIELLSARRDYLDRPLAVAEPFGAGKPQRFSLAEIAADCGARLHIDFLEKVDTAGHRVRTRGGGELAYDVLLIAVGARPKVALNGAIAVRGPRYTHDFRTLLHELDQGRLHRVAFAVPPGGAWPLRSTSLP